VVRIVWKLAEKLTQIEVRILDLLSDGKERKVEEISEELNEDYARVSRGLMFLENKGLVVHREEEKEEIIVTEKGSIYLEKLLPEDCLLDLLTQKSPIDIKEIELSEEEKIAAIGVLKRFGIIEIREGKIFLKKKELLNRTPRFRSLKLAPEEIDEFIKRGLLRKEKKIIRIYNITDLGKSVLEKAKKLNLLDKLTREIIISGAWKERKFRRYDVESPVPKIYFGALHPFREVLRLVRNAFLELGFREMREYGWLETCLWVFDTLVTPQDHPARDMHDSFYAEGFVEEKDRKLIEKVKEVHKKLWKYEYDEKLAGKLILRTHTTAVSARTMHRFKEGKWFIVGRVFRNERIDWKHLQEFYQVEGIIIEEDVSLSVLIGVLKEFYSKLGFKEVKFMPAYFPYTEPSLQVMVKIGNKWVELGGAGIFREEINEIFDIKYPVAAWGLGLERLAMIYYNLKDVRDVWYRTRISFIQSYGKVLW